VNALLGILKRPGATPSGRRSALLAMFRILPDRFWARHVHFRSRGPGRGIALGSERVHEIIVSEIVPLLLIHARLEGDVSARRETTALFRSLPPSKENRVTRRVQSALKGGRFLSCSPLEHQGMLHLYRLYCSAGRCARCPVTIGPARGTPTAQRERPHGVRMSHRRLQVHTSSSRRQ